LRELQVSDFIREYWDNQAIIHKSRPSASWSDDGAIALEMDFISSQFQASDYVLDVGCANGFALFDHFSKCKLENAVGVDFSEKMIAEARNRLKESNLSSLSFRHADVRELPFPDQTFDVVYTTRVLINLPSWQQQKIGIDECLRVTKNGGKVVFSEAFFEPYMKLSALRQVLGLAPLREHDFNRYIKEDDFEHFLSERNIEFRGHDFSSIYYVGTRLLRELVTDEIDITDYNNPFNQAFKLLEDRFSCSGLSLQKGYVLHK
jgi:SAM-dependent methyltransferase